MASGRETPLRDEKVAVIGSGKIGRSWAMLFASAGYRVALYDRDSATVQEALTSIQDNLSSLQELDLLRGSLTVQQIVQRIEGLHSLKEALKGAIFVEECIWENLEQKKALFGEIDELIGDEVTLASSTSSLTPSLLSESLRHRERFIVTHPTNPPFCARCVELVPAPWTCPEAVSETRALMEEMGQEPVLLKKEIDGFLVNRLHFALLAESWRLVKGGYVTADGLGRVLSSGLGPRYAFMGPFQTAHLNATGFKDYCDKYGDMIFRVQQSFGPPERMGGDVAAAIQEELLKTFSPLESLEEKRQWRYARLAALSKLKTRLSELERGKAEQDKDH